MSKRDLIKKISEELNKPLTEKEIEELEELREKYRLKENIFIG